MHLQVFTVSLPVTVAARCADGQKMKLITRCLKNKMHILLQTVTVTENRYLVTEQKVKGVHL
jgi:hypothetical protein